jgi:hypothetical protein
MWLLYGEIGGNDTAHTPVVGIFIEYDKKAREIIATDIGVALRLIEAARST